MEESERVLQFWFGELDTRGCADAAHAARWWKKDAAFDAEISQSFGALHAAITAGEREAWRSAPRPCLAYVIVLDQFSRNMFRGSARTFASDRQALAAAVAAIDRGADRELAVDERAFLYMPLVHCEDIAAQERSVALFGELRSETDPEPGGRIAMQLEYARKHRDIVARFGRFPHRNAALGRVSSAEELAFLAEPGSSF